MKFSVWQDNEVKELFKIVEKTKEERKPLKEAFLLHAQNFRRKANSVRNYYYHEVDNLVDDETRRKRLGIDLSRHLKNKLIPFSKRQEDEFLEKVEKMQKEGKSIRAICYQLSGGDMKLMTRLQNKFQNLKRENAKHNIIAFQKRQKKLSMDDINSLFAGLVKLIKKTASEEVEERYEEEKMTSKYLLDEAYRELNQKIKELEKLKESYKILKDDNLSLSTKLKEYFNLKAKKNLEDVK